MKKGFLSALLLILVTQIAIAAPVKTQWGTYTQPDGTTITLRLCGDEFHHYYMTQDGAYVTRDADGYFRYTVIDADNNLVAGDVLASEPIVINPSDNSKIATIHATLGQEGRIKKFSRTTQRQAPMRKAAQMGAESDGTVKGLILLVEFKDVKFTTQKSIIDNMMNQEGYTDNLGSIGSARDYFNDQSYGKFKPQFNVIGPITLSNNMSYYGGNDSGGVDKRPDVMVSEACQIASDNNLVDMSDYDLDNDGWVDLVYVIYAGYGENVGGADANCVWPHAWYIYQGAGRTVTIDNVTLDAYACSAELSGASGTKHEGIGTFCHEYSHTLGLPDWYDIDYSGGMGMSKWSIMDSGSYACDGYVPIGYNAYERWFCGWLELNELTDAASITMKELSSDNATAYRINANENQFITIECRQWKDWDNGLPAQGVMIIAVDYSASAWNKNAPNDDPYRQRFSLIPADNKWNERTLAGDLFPYNGNNKLTSSSSPAMKVYTTTIQDKPITNITYNNGVATFDFKGGSENGLEAPVATSAGNVTTSGFTAYWSPVSDAKSYNLYVERVEDVAEGDPNIAFSENFDKFTANSNTDISGDLDSYTSQPGWSGSKVFCNNGIVKLGSSSKGGSLKTPSFATTKSHTIYLSACAYSSSDESGTMTLYIQYDGGVATCPITLDQIPSGGLYTIALKSNNTGDDCNISIECDKRIYLDNIKVEYITEEAAMSHLRVDLATGEITRCESFTMQKAPVVTESYTFSNITNTQYDVTHVVNAVTPGTYRYKVQAVNILGASPWSNVIEVVISNNSAIDEVAGNNSKVYAANGTIYISGYTDKATIYNMQGVVVATLNITDGVAAYTTATPGIYLVQCGNNVTKVMVH